MDKLIDYTGLGTFQTNLLNDSSVSAKATWSSEKIDASIMTVLSSLESRIYALEHPTTVE